jgi:hypothetical protein
VVAVPRSRLLAGGLAVAVLVAAVGIVLVVRVGSGNLAAPDHSAVAPVPEDIAASCPAPGRDLPYPADGVLPEGAVAVRLCNGPLLRTDTGQLLATGFDAPDDVLTTGVGDLVDLVNGLEPAVTEGRLCHSIAGPRFAYWFLYPDGDARAVLYDAGGCRDTTTAPGRLAGGGQALERGFARALLAQRAHEEPPGTDEVAGCNPNDAPVSPIVTSDLAFATLTYCTLPDGSRYREGHLTAAQVATANRDIRAGASSRACTGRPFSMVRGYTVWGDRVVTSGTCHRYRLGRGTWTPSPRVVRMLEGLVMGPPEKQCAAFKRGHRNQGCPLW